VRSVPYITLHPATGGTSVHTEFCQFVSFGLVQPPFCPQILLAQACVLVHKAVSHVEDLLARPSFLLYTGPQHASVNTEATKGEESHDESHFHASAV
jgi:hypothetical protein